MDLNEPVASGKRDKRSGLREVMEWVQAILIAVVLAFLIRGFIFEQAMVEGSSMDNTLHNNQRLIIYKLGYYFSPPERRDIIILEYKQGMFKYLPFPDPDEVDYIKRVIAIPGDVVDINGDGYVYVNGERLKEPYVKGVTAPNGMVFPITIPEKKVFVLGDNREYSSDSRQIGLIDFDRIRGKAVYRIFPFKDWGTLYDNLK
ncbi:signal peptidase I [Anaerobacterium chartisolvens]|uniref:Signal peptidase I n=1 Tax=Anaerobacterium chartisolvens TaxID=1297424 RepID=A0A369BF41_9FIRM|nr:signal peptidase I [Anaerobacterium chartisolvens]RCX20041.1 signal peptidase I [Anaerobacterium chartisolvens]